MSASRTQGWFRKRPYRPTLEYLEDRVTPALNLSISTAATSNVAGATVMGTTTFTATNTGANLNVADILTELNNGNNVVIDTGNIGAEDGNITWAADADLDFNGINDSLLLQLRTAGSVGNISVAADIRDSNFTGPLDTDLLQVIFDSQDANGTIQVDGSLQAIAGLTVEAGAGDFNLASTMDVISREAVLITAATAAISTDLQIVANTQLYALDIDGNIDFIGDRLIHANDGFIGNILFQNGSMTLGGALDIVLDDTLAESVILYNADLDIGTHDLIVTDSSASHEFQVIFGSSLSGTGTVTAPSTLVASSFLRPGGEAVGNLLFVGNLVFDANGFLEVNLGTTSDQVTVLGAITIEDGARLIATGVLPNATPATLLQTDAAGSLVGVFAGTGGEVPFVLGTDAVTASYTETPGSLAVSQVPAGPNTVTVFTPNGDIATIRLRGGGPARLVVGNLDVLGVIQFVVVRNARKQNFLQITVTPNGGNGTVGIANMLINGRIDRVIAKTTDLSLGRFEVTGNVRKVAVRNIASQDLILGGNSSQPTTITSRTLNFSSLESTSRIASLTTHLIVGSSFIVPTIGKLHVTRNEDRSLPAGIDGSTFLITENRGKKRNGLGTAIINGAVGNTTFTIQNGNVNLFRTGLFFNSKLYVGYTPPPSMDIADVGQFSATNFVIRTFETTFTPNVFTSNIFGSSQIVAPRLGTVRLSGVTLDNSGTLFGLRVKDGVANNVRSVRIQNTPPFVATQDYLPSPNGEVDPSVGGLGAQIDFRFFV